MMNDEAGFGLWALGSGPGKRGEGDMRWGCTGKAKAISGRRGSTGPTGGGGKGERMNYE